MIGWSDAAKYARSIFYKGFNDIDVFVEDTANESRKVYVELLSRVLGGKVAVSQVFPIGSKPTVIKRCAADQGARNRRAVYIIDGDYDIALGIPVPPLGRLYRLNAYCIENYLLDPEAIIDVLADESTEIGEGEIGLELDLGGWLGRVSKPMAILLTALILSHKCQCGLPSVKFDLNRIQGRFRDYVDDAKVLDLVSDYSTAIDHRIGAGSYSGLSATIRPAGLTDELFFARYCSGKYVLMPLLRSRIARKFGSLVDYPIFRVKLARRCDVSELSDLGAAIA